MIHKLKKDIDLEIKSFLVDLKKKYAFSGSSKLLFDGIKDFVLRDGKRIRPVLYILGYRGYSKKKVNYRKLLRSALAFELLHDFFLIHDDVIDNSDLRRGKPTLHRYYRGKVAGSSKSLGEGLSIVAGDLLYAACIERFMEIDEAPKRKETALKEFTDSAFSTCIGEFIDVVEGEKEIDAFTEKNAYTIYELKTAKYTFVGPMLTGAVLAGAGRNELKKISGLGSDLGLAFQIVDDLLDLVYTSKDTGKQGLSDLKEAKKTLLVWKAYSKLKGNDKKIFSGIFLKKKKTIKDFEKLKGFIIRSGSPGYCLEKAYKYMVSAEHISNGLNINNNSRKLLKSIVSSLHDRIDLLRSRLSAENNI